MTHSFERFGLEHLSPSSLNLWRASPGVWALRYIARISDKGAAAMWRGTAVEDGLRHHLMGRTWDEAVKAARNSYMLNAGNADMTMPEAESIEEEAALITPMLDQAAKWKPPGPLNAVQLRVEHFFDPVPIPIIGYVDMAFDGIDVDLKSTKAIPSTPRFDHVRQVSLYRAARGRAGGLLYVSAKRHAYYDIDDEAMEIALETLRSDALSLNNFLSRMDTKDDVLKSLPVDWDNYRAPKTRVPLADILLAG